MKRYHWVAAAVGVLWGLFSSALLNIERLREPVFHYDNGRYANLIAAFLPSVWAMIVAQRDPIVNLFVAMFLGAAVAALLAHFVAKLLRFLGRRLFGRTG